MLMFFLLSGCITTDASESVVLALPGEVTRAALTVTDDGDVLTLRRVPPDVPWGVAFLWLLLPSIGLISGVTLWRKTRLGAGLITVVSLGCEVVLIYGATIVDQTQIGRSAQQITLHYRLPGGPVVHTIQQPFSAFYQVGVLRMANDTGAQPIVLELLGAEDERRLILLGTVQEADAIPFAEALRDHVAEAMGGLEVTATRSAWW